MEYIGDVLAIMVIGLAAIWIYWPVTTGLKADLKIACRGYPELETEVNKFLSTKRPTGFKAGLLYRRILKEKQRIVADS